MLMSMMHRMPDPPTNPPKYDDDNWITCPDCGTKFREDDKNIDEDNVKTEYCKNCIGEAYYENVKLLQPTINELKGNAGLIKRERYMHLLNRFQKMIDASPFQKKV